MANCIENTHATQPVGQGATDGEPQVDIPQRLSGFGDPWRQLGVFHWPRSFGTVKLHATDSEHWHYSDCQYDDAHAAEPLQLLAVIQDGSWQLIYAGEDSGASSCQARHRFE